MFFTHAEDQGHHLLMLKTYVQVMVSVFGTGAGDKGAPFKVHHKSEASGTRFVSYIHFVHL